jgi:hypothetical protein
MVGKTPVGVEHPIAAVVLSLLWFCHVMILFVVNRVMRRVALQKEIKSNCFEDPTMAECIKNTEEGTRYRLLLLATK